MNKRVAKFFEELRHNSELKSKLDKIIELYPEREVLDSFSAEKQLKFICEVILPFARNHGFDFDLTDIVLGDNISELEDLYLGKISGGNGLGRKITAGTLAAINMLTFVSPVDGFAKGAGSSVVGSVNRSIDENLNDEYGDILDVLKRNSVGLHPINDKYPINEVDCLIFSTISYLPLNFVPLFNSDLRDEDITVSEWAEKFFEYEKTKHEKLILHKEDSHTMNRYIKFKKSDISTMDAGRKQLLKLVSESPRYKNIKVGDFVGKYVEYEESKRDSEQFAAVTFTLEDGTKIVSFRGTDGTMAGWKEDLDLSWSRKVLAQEHALEYLRKVFALYPDSKFFVVGHSKGGNLALYSSFYLCNESQDFFKNLINIFNYDGPGLNKHIVSDIKTDLYKEVSKKLVTYIPPSSLIGRIMDYTSKGKVYCVNSFAKEASDILLQHDSMTWNVSYNYENKDTEKKFESNVVQAESDFMADATALFVESVEKENSMRFFVQWVFDFMSKNNISIDDSRSVDQICKDVFYNYFIKNKSINDIINIIFAPSTAVYMSESDQQSLKNVMHAAFSSLIKSYWRLHIELNNRMGLSPKLNKALEDLVKSDYSWSGIYNVAKVVNNDVLTWENVKNFFKKLYGN